MGGGSVVFNKPDGWYIRETFKLMNVSSDNVLMVGDTINDVAAAGTTQIYVLLPWIMAI